MLEKCKFVNPNNNNNKKGYDLMSELKAKDSPTTERVRIQ